MAMACTHRRPDATREAPAVIMVSINWQLARDRPGRRQQWRMCLCKFQSEESIVRQLATITNAPGWTGAWEPFHTWGFGIVGENAFSSTTGESAFLVVFLIETAHLVGLCATHIVSCKRVRTPPALRRRSRARRRSAGKTWADGRAVYKVFCRQEYNLRDQALRVEKVNKQTHGAGPPLPIRLYRRSPLWPASL